MLALALTSNRVLTPRLSLSRSHTLRFTRPHRCLSSISENREIPREVVGSLPKVFKQLKTDLPGIIANLKDRDITDICVAEVVALYDHHATQSQLAQQLRRERNLITETLKTPQGRLDSSVKEKAKNLREEIKVVEKELEELSVKLAAEAKKFPNSTHPDVPRNGEPNQVTLIGEKPNFDFTPRSHWEIGQMWDLFDFERGAEVAAAGYYYAKNEAALLEMALINWATQKVARKNFTPVLTPDLVNVSYAEACGFRPRSEASQMYAIQNSNLCLIGTSEIPLAGLQAHRLYYSADFDQLPVRYVGYSHCFRRETGHGGALTRGIFRVHQFSKVEMFVVCLPEDSDNEHQALLNIEIEIFKELGLHFRVLDMPSNDLGAPAYRKYDTEAWFPSRSDYGEISSASNCTDYQSRRLNLRAKDKEGQTFYLHTLNATALAVPRIMMAILENFQQQDGTVRIPQPLVPYMGGISVIGGNK